MGNERENDENEWHTSEECSVPFAKHVAHDLLRARLAIHIAVEFPERIASDDLAHHFACTHSTHIHTVATTRAKHELFLLHASDSAL